MIFQREFFNTVVHADGADVPFNEAAFTIAFDQARFANFLGTNRSDLETHVVWLGPKSEILP